MGAGSAATSTLRVPTLENSGQVAAKSVPIALRPSAHTTLPSDAPGLIEKPSGSVSVAERSSDGEGVRGLCVCGTFRSVSSPDAVSACEVVAFAVKAGLKLAWLQP